MSELLGARRVASTAEATAQLFGDHVFTFSPHGELVQTDLTAAGPKRSLLTWTTRDELLVIDPPSAPREDRIPFGFADGALLIDGSRYRREAPSSLTDPDAIGWALVAAFGRDHAPASQHAMTYRPGPDGPASDRVAITFAAPR